jgi:signal peptidase II
MEFLYIGIILLIDQVSKILVKMKLKPVDNIDLVNNFFSLTYVENTGAAFGKFSGYRFILIGITSCVVVFMLVYLVKNKNINQFLRVGMILVIAGAIGNLIDRIYMGYVVDFIHFYTKSRDLPVFNVADISVVIGTFILATSLIFSKE